MREVWYNREELPEFPTVPLFTSEFGVTGLCQCPSWEVLGIPMGLAAGCAKMILGSFKLTLLWLFVVLLLPDLIENGTFVEWGGLPGAEWITGPWIGQEVLGSWIWWWWCIWSSPRLCKVEYWPGGDWGKLNKGSWTWWGGCAPCCGWGTCLDWDIDCGWGWLMEAGWEEFCGNCWGCGE